MGGIGQQQHPRTVGHDLDHLAHQAAGVEHRHAQSHAVLAALVDDHALGKGIGVDTDQLADQYLLIDQLGGIEQLTQAHILLGQRRQLLQAPLQQQSLGLELLVLGQQLAATADRLGHVVPQAIGQIGQPVQRRGEQTDLTAQRLEGIEARIHHHQADRQHGEHQQAHPERRTFHE